MIIVLSKEQLIKDFFKKLESIRLDLKKVKIPTESYKSCFVVIRDAIEYLERNVISLIIWECILVKGHLNALCVKKYFLKKEILTNISKVFIKFLKKTLKNYWKTLPLTKQIIKWAIYTNIFPNKNNYNNLLIVKIKNKTSIIWTQLMKNSALQNNEPIIVYLLNKWLIIIDR